MLRNVGKRGGGAQKTCRCRDAANSGGNLRRVQTYTIGRRSSTRSRPLFGRPITLISMPKFGRVGAVSVAVVIVLTMSAACAGERPTPTATPHRTTASAAPVKTPSATPTVPAFDKTQLSITDPNSIWVVANKIRPLNPVSYAPTDLITVPVAHDNPPIMRKVAGDALVTMFAAAAAEGAGGMQIQSAYRSYPTQVAVYAG